MRRQLVSFGIISLGVLSMAIRPHTPVPPPPPPPVSPPPVATAKKVVTTQQPAVAPPAPSAAPVASTAAPGTAPNSVERARQGVVVLERQGRAVALGVVLEGDGRILSALSSLTNGNFLNARYSDGALVPVKLVHSDRGWDLALLSATVTPTQPLHKTGLRAAKTPSFVALQTFNLTPPNTISAAPMTLKLSAGMLGGDAAALVGAYELGTKPALAGGPVVNSEGEAVAVVARACPAVGNGACVPAAYGAPVSALKQFLQRVPAEATWLGINAAADATQTVQGVRVVSVVPSSPAAVGGVRPGPSAAEADLIVAVDGAPVTTPAALNEAVRARTVGDSVELLIFGMGRYRHVTVKPRPAPQLTQPPYVAPKPGKPRTPNPYR